MRLNFWSPKNSENVFFWQNAASKVATLLCAARYGFPLVTPLIALTPLSIITIDKW